MNEKRAVAVSKYLSRHLRHAPADLGLTLEPGGWVAVDELLSAAGDAGFPITRDELAAVVAGSDKQRFAFDDAGTMIRANQGHSVAVDLELSPVRPPDELFHGTPVESRAVIVETGLSRMNRHHVHLSADVDTAVRVGRRRGLPVVFSVDSGTMDKDGYTFFLSANGVWLVDHVPARYLRIHPPTDGSET